MGSYTPSGTNNWLQGGVGTVLGNATGAMNNGLQQWQGLSGNVSNTAGYDLPVASSALMGMINGANSPSLQANENYFTQNIPQMQQGFTNYSNPQTQSAAQSLQGIGNTANQVFQGGGWTPQYAQQYSQLGNYLNGQTPGVQTSAGTANSLVGSQGANNYNQTLQGDALTSAGNNGMTSTLSMLLNPMQGIINSQGNNAQSNALMGGGNPLIASQGQTGITQGLESQGMNLFNQQALMNPAQAASLARNQAATDYSQQAQHAESQALARGGGAGATVANGMQNQGMADFANQAAQGTSSAVTSALQNQQQLQLQQQLTGGQIANSAGNLQNAFLGTGGGMTNQSGNLANSLYMGGMGLAPTTQNAATNNMSAYLSGGNNGSTNQLGMLGAGSSLAQMLETGQLGGLNAYNSTMGNQNQYALGSGGLGQTAANNLYGNTIAGGTLANSQFQNILNGMSSGYGTQNSTLTGLNNTQNNQYNPLTGLAGQILGFGNTGLSTQGQLMQGYGNAIAASNPFNAMLAAAGTVAGAIPKGGA